MPSMLPARLRQWMAANNNQGGKNDGPPDLEEMWRDFNRTLSGLFGQKGPQRPPETPRPDGPRGPEIRRPGLGLGLIAVIAGMVWLGSGFFIVQEGEQAVITTFGRYAETVDAGFHWRMPYPVQAHETVKVTQLRSVDVGRTSVVQATGLRDSSMLTQDENIVDIRFTVQYRLKDARAYLFTNREPDIAVAQAAESAVREIVGRSKVDQVLYEQRDAIATELGKSVQAQLDRLQAGIQVVAVNVQHVQVPEQVQAAFNDAVKAGADRDRYKNEGQAYASDVIPKARGTAARLKEEAAGYSQRVVAQAEGDAERFRQVLTEYQRAPQVTRDRLYLDTMRTVYSNVTKVLVDSKGGNQLINLPLDRLIQATAAGTAAGTPAPAAVPTDVPTPPLATTDARSRESSRSRERESR